MDKENKPIISSDGISILESVENLPNLLEQVSDCIYITDLERRIIFWNTACEKVTGYKAKEVLDKRCADDVLNHIDMAGNKICSTNLCPLYRAMAAGQSSEQPLIVKALHKNGSRIVVEVSVAPIRNKQGTVVGGMEIFRDISEKVDLEEQKARFFSALSHELKTPLTSMQGYLDLLLAGDAGDLNDIQKEFITTIHNQEQKLAGTIDELLEMARFESTDFSYESNLFDLSLTLENLANSFRADAAAKKLDYSVNIIPGLKMLGDRERLAQAFGNLISNAIKYTEKGFVSIEADYNRKNDMIRVAVSDSGIGIPEEDHKAVFEMFYRVENPGTRSKGGTGVGLYIVDRIVQRHNGMVELNSSPGKGSVFTVYLPGQNTEKKE